MSVSQVIECLLFACADSVGTVRVAGFKSFGDATLNGALSLSPLFLGGQTRGLGDGVEGSFIYGDGSVRKVGDTQRGPGVGTGSGVGSGVGAGLCVGTVLKRLQQGCKDTKLAVSSANGVCVCVCVRVRTVCVAVYCVSVRIVCVAVYCECCCVLCVCAYCVCCCVLCVCAYCVCCCVLGDELVQIH